MQCGSSSLTWDHGKPPFRVEFYYSLPPAAEWIDGMMYNPGENELDIKIIAPAGAVRLFPAVDIPLLIGKAAHLGLNRRQ